MVERVEAFKGASGIIYPTQEDAARDDTVCALAVIYNACPSYPPNSPSAAWVDFMIANADALYDALAPYVCARKGPAMRGIQ